MQGSGFSLLASQRQKTDRIEGMSEIEREDKMKQMMKEKQGEEFCKIAAREVMSL